MSNTAVNQWVYHSHVLNKDFTPVACSEFFSYMLSHKADPLDMALYFNVGSGAIMLYASNPNTIPSHIAKKVERAIVNKVKFAQAHDYAKDWEDPSHNSRDKANKNMDSEEYDYITPIFVSFVNLCGWKVPIQRLTRGLKLLRRLGVDSDKFTKHVRITGSFYNILSSRSSCKAISARTARLLEAAYARHSAYKRSMKEKIRKRVKS